MSLSGSEMTAAAKNEEEERLYGWIYDLQSYDLEEKFPYSPELSPVNPEVCSEMETYAAEAAEGQGMNVSETTRGMNKKRRFFDKKLWMRPGANISDYFNYGFDEETWNAYCKKQTELLAFRRQHAKITAQRMLMEDGEEEPCCSYSSSDRSSIPNSRESNGDIDVSGGRDGCSRAADGRPCLSDGAKTTQVVSEMFRMEDSTTSNNLMPLRVDNKSLFAFFPPPSSLFQPEHPPSSSSAVLGSEHNQGFYGPSTSRCQRFSGRGKCKKDRNRSRAGARDKERKRCRDRENQNSSSSHNSSVAKQKKRRRSTEHGHKHPSTEAQRMTEKTRTEDTNTSKRKKKAKKRGRKNRN